MRTLFLAILLFMFILNKVHTEDTCPYVTSKKACEETLFKPDRKFYFDEEEVRKITETLKQRGYESESNFHRNFIQATGVHNWKLVNYENLFKLKPDISLQEIISMAHYADGKWWNQLLQPNNYNKKFEINLINEINLNIKNVNQYKKRIDNYLLWRQTNPSALCTFKELKQIFRLLDQYELKQKLKKELFEPKYVKSDLPTKSPHFIFDMLCRSGGFLDKPTEEPTNLEEVISLINNLLEARILHQLIENPNKWTLKDVVDIIIDYQGRNIISPYMEDIISTAIDLNIDSYNLKILLSELETSDDYIPIDVLEKTSKSLSAVGPFIEGIFNGNELAKLIIVTNKYFTKYETNSEDAFDKIESKLKGTKLEIAKIQRKLTDQLNEQS
ncbi:uncharacterized protein LOC142326983 [Lycorma delicatula]|uniref:uncharacterized protein LOC142326983 n=1 Tax=Lycorma delicatula TaxID=130591 RepID=UPI003F519A3B